MKVFLDTSVLFSALYSTTGGSALLAQLTRKGVIIAITTQTVIEELEQNIAKLKEKDPHKIYRFVEENNFLVRESISLSEIEPYQSIIEKKDAHVLTGAILTKCDYLVTHDKKHLNNRKVKAKIKTITILSPKELLLIIDKLDQMV